MPILGVAQPLTSVFGAVGWRDFNDLATHTTPLAMPLANTWYDVSNDNAGPYSEDFKAIPGRAALWDSVNQQFDFTGVGLGDIVLIRYDLIVTTPPACAITIQMSMAIGGAGAYALPLFHSHFKDAGAQPVGGLGMLYIGTPNNPDTKDYPAKLQISSTDAGASVEVNGWALATLAL